MFAAAEGVSLCSFRMDDGVFGFETHKVHEVLGVRAVHAVSLAPEFVAGAIPYRGEILTVLSFRKILRFKPQEKLSNIIVLEGESEGELFGLTVDAMADVLNVAAENFEENPATLDALQRVLFAGRYRTGDGFVTHLKPELLWPMRLMELLAAG